MSKGNPLKSALSIGNVDDTALALPSVNQTRTAQQRVLEQVQSIKRTKSRISSSSSRSGSTLSPTSPSYDSVFEETQKSPQSTSNGIVFFKKSFSRSLSQEKNIAQQKVNISMGSNVNRYTTSSHYKRYYAPAGLVGVGRGNTSRSEPDLLSHQRSVPPRSVPSKRIQTMKGSAHSSQKVTNQFIINTTAAAPPPPLNAANGQIKSSNQFICSRIDTVKVPKPAVTESTSKSKKVDAGSNGNAKVADITMKEAVDYLSSTEETYQHCGASYIQHSTFIDNKAKEEVLKLNGIPLLVNLLCSPSLQVNSTASAALRNLSFKSDKNKEEIQRCGGITQAVALLHKAGSLELQKQLTGLLWNLSSVDDLKPELLKSALPVLMERVILPYTTGPNQETNNSQNPEIFTHTTGCLRNLSSSKHIYRQTLRKCPSLIDSLVRYIQGCVEAGKPDDESAENCVCILHNLTFQLEAEAPDLFSRIKALGKNMNRSNNHDNASPVGCFSTQSKSLERESHFDFPVIEDPQPVGPGWLFHSKTMGNYLSLLSSSQREETQEACCGALQNLTTHEGIVSTIMGQTIVQKLGGLRVIGPLLNSKKVNLQRNTVALLGNLTKNPVLHSAIGRKGLPELLEILSNGTTGANESDDILSMACQASSCLLMKNPEMNKNLLNSKLINSLNDISKNIYFPKSSKAAAVLLCKLWSDKDLQSFLKKQGMSKSSFVNDITIAAQRSLQDADVTRTA
ncbi:plakophilin-1 [Archocentrus centrarchus]|uniref:plakophilin-1 n=1 Tax=Archocentrus centrarchus TaxID=63155 RepID=UPI0011EA4BD3|nr:plakophilin-1-like [Archocentrus centrarchus]